MPAIKSIEKRSMISASLKKSYSKYKYGVIFLAPFLILFTLFYILPVFTAFGISFTNFNMIQSPSFLGIKNYQLLFTDDSVFLLAIQNTFVFAAIVGPIGYIASFVMAWIINQLKLRNAFSLAFYAPSITSGIAMSVVWMVLFSSDRYGLINNALLKIGLIDEPILWNADPEYIMRVVIIVALWMSMGTGFLVFLAGLQSIHPELYEAASIDVASGKFEQLWYITVPQMKPQMLFGAVTSIVSSFGVFEIALAIGGLPSPNYAAHTIVAHLFDYAFIRFQLGYASAVAVFLFLLTFSLGRISMRIFSSKK